MGSCLSVHASSASSTTSASASASASASSWLRRHKRRNASQACACASAVAENVTDDCLARIPGRMCSNGSSTIACLFTQQGRKGTNQDAMLVWEDFGSKKDTVFCGVFDGHGPFGHLVAKRVRDSLPSKLCSQWDALANGEGTKQGESDKTIPEEETLDKEWRDEEEQEVVVEEESTKKVQEAFLAWKESFLKAFKVMDKELRLHPTIDCFCSGTTAVTLIKQGDDLVMGNVGDSRAVLATRDTEDFLTAIQLTVDLKPNLPKEAERIKQFKGRVFALQDEPDVARVWLPNEDSPGLAMARAFGDFCLKDFGLIAVPDISYRHLTERDEFIVLATDGVWDVLSNEEVVEIVASAPTRSTAARSLVEFAVRAWRLKYPTSRVDDCAVVCLFLNDPPVPRTSGSKCGKQTVSVATKAAAEDDEDAESAAASPSPTLGRLNTVRNTGCGPKTEIIEEEEEEEEEKMAVKQVQAERSQSRRSLAECLSVAEEDEWCALEGVSRVNSLLNLPRFLTLAGDISSGRWRKHHR